MKKLSLTFLLSALIIGSVFTTANAFTAKDARIILRASVGLEDIDGETAYSFDLDANGVLSSFDARIALRCAVGLQNYTPMKDNGFSQYPFSIVDTEKLYTYDNLTDDLEALSSCMPSRFSYKTLGKTADGREIFCAVLGSGFGRRQIIVDAGIHGSEYLNPPAVMSAVEFYLRNYDNKIYNNKTVREILRDTDIYILPMLNPDGIAISQFGTEGLRSKELSANILDIYKSNYSKGKTTLPLSTYLKEWKANANGVDLNRNFMTENNGIPYYTGVNIPSSENFAGEYSFSEPESLAYKNLIENLSNPVAVLSIHSQGNLIYWDCSQSRDGKKAAKKLAETVKKETGYYLDMSDSFTGASADWTMTEKNIPSITVECGRGHNPMPLSVQQQICETIRYIFLAVAESM